MKDKVLISIYCFFCYGLTSTRMEKSCKEQIFRHHTVLAWFCRKLDVGQFEPPNVGHIEPMFNMHHLYEKLKLRFYLIQ